jgi:hypothetical protein
MAAFLVCARACRDARGTIARKSGPDKPQVVLQDGRIRLEVERPDRHCLGLAAQLGRTYWRFVT